MCLRFITDYQDTVSPSLFTLSPQTSPLQLAASGAETYRLSSGSYAFRELYLKPNIRIRSYIDPDIWTRLCLIVDTRRDVAQVFSGPNMSIRKILSNPVRSHIYETKFHTYSRLKSPRGLFVHISFSKLSAAQDVTNHSSHTDQRHLSTRRCMCSIVYCESSCSTSSGQNNKHVYKVMEKKLTSEEKETK